jgi:hypothetical protein
MLAQITLDSRATISRHVAVNRISCGRPMLNGLTISSVSLWPFPGIWVGVIFLFISTTSNSFIVPFLSCDSDWTGIWEYLIDLI